MAAHDIMMAARDLMGQDVGLLLESRKGFGVIVYRGTVVGLDESGAGQVVLDNLMLAGGSTVLSRQRIDASMIIDIQGKES